MIYDQTKYTKQLTTNGLSYLFSRGLTAKTIEAFEIGEALDYRTEKSNLDGKPIRNGKKQKGKNSYGFNNPFEPVFSNRIMFPVFNDNNDCVGFSGRIYTENSKYPKYFNSAESPTYNKSELLFGLKQCKGRKYVAIPEGQFCVATIYQNDNIDAVAPLGKFSSHHATMIAERYNQVLLAGDNDKAGRIFNIDAGIKLLNLGIHVKVVIFPNGVKDPSENGGISALEKKDFFNYSLGLIHNLEDNTRRRIFTEKLECLKWEMATVDILVKFPWLPPMIKFRITSKYRILTRRALGELTDEALKLWDADSLDVLRRDPFFKYILDDMDFVVDDNVRKISYFNNRPKLTDDEEKKLSFLYKYFLTDDSY